MEEAGRNILIFICSILFIVFLTTSLSSYIIGAFAIIVGIWNLTTDAFGWFFIFIGVVFIYSEIKGGNGFNGRGNEDTIGGGEPDGF